MPALAQSSSSCGGAAAAADRSNQLAVHVDGQRSLSRNELPALDLHHRTHNRRGGTLGQVAAGVSKAGRRTGLPRET